MAGKLGRALVLLVLLGGAEVLGLFMNLCGLAAGAAVEPEEQAGQKHHYHGQRRREGPIATFKQLVVDEISQKDVV